MNGKVRDVSTGRIYDFVKFCEWPITGRSYANGHIDHVPHVECLDEDKNKIMIPLNVVEFL